MNQIKEKEKTRLEPSNRLQKLPPYLFVEIDRLKREQMKQGKDVIDLGVGDPDLPTPPFVIEALNKAVRDPANHRYALDQGLPELRAAIGDWFYYRFGVRLNMDTEILPLLGSKEGIGHLPLALINSGDVVLVPDPGYPVYYSATWFAGGESVSVPLLKENNFFPDFESLELQSLDRAKLLYLNYPNNPTSACATKENFKNILSFSKKHGIVVAHDAAYTEITYDGYQAPSILQVEGGKEHAVEFHSLSKTFNMTGWRAGFVVGNAEVIRLLGKVKANLDSGMFQAVQLAAIEALRKGRDWAKENCAIYEKRRNTLVDGLNQIGWKVDKPKATFYVWIPVPPGYTSSELATKLLKDASLVVAPGNGFGPNGEGFIRISVTIKENRLIQAVDRIKGLHGTRH
jgi:LL-diaminopimelate aminotransferase